MGQLLLVLIIIALIYVLYNMDSDSGYKSNFMKLGGGRHGRQCRSQSQNTLNDMDLVLGKRRTPVYDDTSRISNQVFWQSDYSHPERDIRPNLNEEIITPIRPTLNYDGVEYMSGLHKMSRFSCEQS
jgi:hypothetical protein